MHVKDSLNVPPDTLLRVQDIYFILNSPTPTLKVGDLNAKHKAWELHSVSKTGKLLMENVKSQGHEVLELDNPAHAPTDPRHHTDVLDIVLSHKTSLKTLHLRFSFATAADVNTVTNQLVNKIKRTQSMTTIVLLISMSSHGDLPSHIKVTLQQKRRLHKLWARTRYPKLKKEFNNLAREISIVIKDFRGVTWEATINQAGENLKNLNQLCRQLTKASIPICSIANRAGVRLYDVQAQTETGESTQIKSKPPALTKVIANFLHQRRFCVDINEALSAPRPILSGIPQGSCLFPSLYATYTDDIPTPRGHLEDCRHDMPT
ncbi:RNA-directed DNA polymerase from mobile element jockey [Eumeta japonica]|uniref:RNA-directed DNA polymerase from mobile element jockey n=1 Tax=Eumeta variegata TaxID=151549 RepID=A0A4C1WNI9_EUMVA|nr:RNA-directed DNA polymerase from mobile element jockey [Eumeta japonica]